MPIIALTAAAGSPGATTTALGMALAAAPPVLLAEVDPAGSAIIPGYFRYEMGFQRSILGVAASSGSAQMAQLLLQETVDLDLARGRQPSGQSAPGDGDGGGAVGASAPANSVPTAWTSVPAATGPVADPAIAGQGYIQGAGQDGGMAQGSADRDHARLLIPGFAHPRQTGAMADLWPEVADGFRTLSAAGYLVICDLGRATQGNFPMPVLRAADAVIVVVRNTLASVMRSRPGIEALGGQLEMSARKDALMIGVVEEIPGGLGYTSEVIGHAFDIAATTIAWEPAAAAVLSDGASGPRRRSTSSRLLGSYRSVTATALQRIERRRRQLGA